MENRFVLPNEKGSAWWDALPLPPNLNPPRVVEPPVVEWDIAPVFPRTESVEIPLTDFKLIASDQNGTDLMRNDLWKQTERFSG